MKSRKEKVIRTPSEPATLRDEELSNAAGGTQFVPGKFPGRMPPGQHPSPVKTGWEGGN